MNDSHTVTRHCVFRVGGHHLAVEADAVAEVLGARPVTRVPLAPAEVFGLLHLRGRIVTVVDPAVRLGLAMPPDRTAAAYLVLEASGDEWCGLLVDEVLDVMEIPAESVEHPHGTDAASPVTGVFAAADGLVHLLDFRRMIHPPTRPRPQAS